MMKSSVIFSIFIGVICVCMYSSRIYAQPPFEIPPSGGLVVCAENLNTCNLDLDSCNDDLAACEAEGGQIFPGDGYNDPSFGTIGHGPALSYTDNLDGTFTDDNTGYMWEIKDNAGGIHDVNNLYTWTDDMVGDLTDPDGTLFTVFLHALNNTCDGAGVTDCIDDSPCGGGVCGFAGYRDWCIPNIKALQSIVDYSVFSPSSNVPGLTRSNIYWSTTTNTASNNFVWFINFNNGPIGGTNKTNSWFARAVRPCE